MLCRYIHMQLYCKKEVSCLIYCRKNMTVYFSVPHTSSLGHAHNRPQGPKGVPGRLRSQIFLTFGTTRVVGRHPHAPAAFTPRGNPWYSFLEAVSTTGHMVPSVATEIIPSVTGPGIDGQLYLVNSNARRNSEKNNLIFWYKTKISEYFFWHMRHFEKQNVIRQ
jgi:hypothetical protein